MRQRPVSGDEFGNYLKIMQHVPNMMVLGTREFMRDQYCSKQQKVLKDTALIRRKPSETYNEDGTPIEQAAAALPPYPLAVPTAAPGNGSVACGETDLRSVARNESCVTGAARNEPELLNIRNFLDSQTDNGVGGRKRRRGASERQFSEAIRNGYPEAKLYAQLQELERKVDSISTRKRMQVEEALKHPGTCTRTLQIIMWNTHENQVWNRHEKQGAVPSASNQAQEGNSEAEKTSKSQEKDTSDSHETGTTDNIAPKPSWNLFITGRLVDANGEEVAGEGQRALGTLLERVFIELPAHQYPDEHAIEWTCWDGGRKGTSPDHHPNGALPGGGAPKAFSGVSVKREGGSECKVRVMLECTSDPKRFSLSGNPLLGELLGFESGTWSQLLVAFWAYVQDHDLHSDDDVGFGMRPFCASSSNSVSCACVRGGYAKVLHVTAPGVCHLISICKHLTSLCKHLMQTQPLHLNLDEAMSKIMGEDRLAVGRVASRLSDLATSDHPIEIIYALKLTGEPTPVVWEALVQVEDPVLQHMRDLIQVCAASPPSLFESFLLSWTRLPGCAEAGRLCAWLRELSRRYRSSEIHCKDVSGGEIFVFGAFCLFGWPFSGVGGALAKRRKPPTNRGFPKHGRINAPRRHRLPPGIPQRVFPQKNSSENCRGTENHIPGGP